MNNKINGGMALLWRFFILLFVLAIALQGIFACTTDDECPNCSNYTKKCDAGVCKYSDPNLIVVSTGNCPVGINPTCEPKVLTCQQQVPSGDCTTDADCSGICAGVNAACNENGKCIDSSNGNILIHNGSCSGDGSTPKAAGDAANKAAQAPTIPEINPLLIILLAIGALIAIARISRKN